MLIFMLLPGIAFPKLYTSHHSLGILWAGVSQIFLPNPLRWNWQTWHTLMSHTPNIMIILKLRTRPHVREIIGAPVMAGHVWWTNSLRALRSKSSQGLCAPDPANRVLKRMTSQLAFFCCMYSSNLKCNKFAPAF